MLTRRVCVCVDKSISKKCEGCNAGRIESNLGAREVEGAKLLFFCSIPPQQALWVWDRKSSEHKKVRKKVANKVFFPDKPFTLLKPAQKAPSSFGVGENNETINRPGVTQWQNFLTLCQWVSRGKRMGKRFLTFIKQSRLKPESVMAFGKEFNQLCLSLPTQIPFNQNVKRARNEDEWWTRGRAGRGSSIIRFSSF